MKSRFTFLYRGEEIEVSAERRGDLIEIERGGAVYTVQLISQKSEADGGVEAGAGTGESAGGTGAARGPGSTAASASTAAAAQEGEVPAPMTGVIKEILVAEGDAVAEGNALMIMEAMKMDIEVSAYSSGTVRELYTAVGESVQEGQPLVKIA